MSQKYNKEALSIYCTKNNVELIGVYVVVNGKTVIEGKCSTVDCMQVFQKTFSGLINKGGACRHVDRILMFNRKNIILEIKLKFKNYTVYK